MTNGKDSTQEAEEFASEPELPQKLQDDAKGYYNRELMAKGTRIKTLKALLEETGTDLKEWRVDTHRVNSWEQHSRTHGLVTLFQVKANLVRNAPVRVKPVESIGRKLKVRKKKKRKVETVLFMPDTQHGFMWGDRHSSLIPLHDYKAIDAFIQLAIKLQPDKIVLLGDHADFAEWSVKYQTPPEHRDTTQPTLDVLHWHLKQLRAGCPSTEIDWIEGNHDPGPVNMGGSHLGALEQAPLTFRHIAQTDAVGEISGHYHPKASLQAGGRHISRPAFLFDADRLIMPAYGTYTGGLRSQSDVLCQLMGAQARAILTGPTPIMIPMPR